MKPYLISGERFYSLCESNLIKNFFLKASEVFESYGYDYINLSYFEPYEYQELAFGEKAKEAITFKDSGSKEIFGLRLDFTTQVMRTVSSFRSIHLPQKLYYFGSLFSFDKKGFERLQTGVELIGVKKTDADVEVINALVDYLKEIGLKNLKVILSHANIVKKLSGKREEVIKSFSERNLEELRGILGENLFEVLRISNEEEVLSSLDRFSLKEEKEVLIKVGNELTKMGIPFAYDIFEVRDFPYYTGVIFEIYDLDTLQAVAGGGRYDDLSGLFGRDFPATGGAVYLEKLIDNLPKEVEKKDYFIIDRSKKGIGKKLADILRKSGKKVSVDFTERDIKKSISYAFGKGFREVLVVDNEHLRVFSTPEEWVNMTIKEFLELIK